MGKNNPSITIKVDEKSNLTPVKVDLSYNSPTIHNDSYEMFKSINAINVGKSSLSNVGKTLVNAAYAESGNAAAAKRFQIAQARFQHAANIAINPVMGSINLGLSIISENVQINAANRKENRESQYLRDKLGITTNSGGRG